MKYYYLKYFLFVLLAFSGYAGNLQAQDTLTFPQVENSTYHYYLNGQWDSLVSVGKAGLQQDIDYFYLRLRMGIAYFNKGKISRAIQHLNRAEKYNSGDSTALEYLYYSYGIFNRTLYQSAVAKRFRLSTRKRILQYYPFYKNSFSPEAGYQFDQAFGASNDVLIGQQQTPVYGEIDYPLSFMFFGLNYRHYFGGMALNFAYDYFDSRREKKSIYPLWVSPDSLIVNSDKYKVSEHHFYVNTEISVKNKLTIIPAVKYQLVKFQKYNTVWNTDSLKYNFPDSNYTFNNFIGSIGLYKDVGPFLLGLTASYSNIYEKSIYQGALLFTWFPFGNLNLYTTTTVAWMLMPNKGGGSGKGSGAGKAESSNSTGDKSHPVFEEAIGGKVWKKLWIEGQFAYNGLRGYNKANATIVFNNPEQVNYFVGMSATYSISKVIDISVGYQYSQKALSGMHYTTPDASVTDQYLKNSQLIYGGLKWKL